ncbi:mastermind-like protein 2 isoform X2 [Denticeps clupeoides]|uniref:mastermind-like protein 2 isoform X2 n=1 Tax=Denticeps clupeoides TaxID=299321 RepID=UPI0010A37AA9|nr:mastermind-like protein 2 isoform X2 [Denticeps clupeoides]
MGEAAPAVGGFVPMLGSMPSGTPRGSAVPQLHSAIVERLRARIELCRRHHSTCESRYQRGQAETSDREHESTLHLLSLVHRGPGGRKAKGGRAAPQQANGEPKGQNPSEAEPKSSTRIALQGSLRRKIEGHPAEYKPNGMSCGPPGPDFKRIRVDVGRLPPGSCSLGGGQSQSHMSSCSLGHNHCRKDPYMIPHGVGSDIFNMTLRDMKKEPDEVQTCSQSSIEAGMMMFEFKDEPGGQIDPELQDLFDELTKSVPSLNDPEFEKMLKQDDTFGLDLGRPNSAGMGNPCPLMDKPIKTEYSPDFSQNPRPASAGPSFSMTTSSISSVQLGHGQVSQASAGPSRALPGWPEVSHAEQLKQMAANQLQPNGLLHHSHQNQQLSWSLAMGSHSPGSFTQEKLPSSTTLCPQRISPQSNGQSKTMNNCLFKPQRFNGSNQAEMKVLSSKPMLQFTPKATATVGQQGPHISSPHNKATQPQQPSPGQNQNHSHGGLHFQSPPLPLATSPCHPPKPLPSRPPVNQQAPGMHFKMGQQRPDKAGGAQDQFSRHLTRPPPDYKQPRSAGGVQQSHLYAGINSSQPLTSKGQDQSDLRSMSCQLSNSQAAKMIDRRFGSGQDPHPGSCQLRQPLQGSNRSRMGLHPGKGLFQGSHGPGMTFGRTSVGQEGLLGKELSSMTSVEAGMSWTPGPRQPGLDVKRVPGAVPPQGAQVDMGGHTFTQRPIAPPNQVPPNAGLLLPRPAVGGAGSAPRPCPPRMPPLPGSFPTSDHNPGNFQTLGGSGRPGRLTFDFLPEGDNTVPGINTESDFIDSLLKSGTGNDDWMKDINLEEILGGHS